MANYNNISGNIPHYDFSSFVPTKTNVFPNNRLTDFITVGPFVLKTDGSFEAEHMYQRDKILLEDYLSTDGGEKNIVPYLNARVTNKYYGDEFLYWKKGFIKWDALRFDSDDDSACDPALFVTEQRNAVFYAATYVDCQKDEPAVILYYNSGSSLFLNGELIDFKPFGRVKGVWTLGNKCPVVFKKGRNLLLFKLRPGYIADTMDLSMTNCSIFPVTVMNKGLGLTTPSITRAYSGTLEEPKQIFPAFAAAFGNTTEAEVDYSCGKLKIPAMENGQVQTIRYEIPTGETEGVKKHLVNLGNSSAEFYFPTSLYDGFKGTEHTMADFHFDTTYHQEQRTYALGAFHITKCMVENLIKNPDFKAILSELDYLHPFYTIYPQYRDVMRKCFKEGRSEADCFFNQPNDLTSSGEAFIRNLIYGQLYHRDVMGRLSTVYGPEDVFGHFSQITQVCSKGGCNYIKWGKAMLGVDSLFRHVSPDGTWLIHDKGNGREQANRFHISGCSYSSGALSYIEGVPRDDTEWMKKTISNLQFSVYSDMANDVNTSVKELDHKDEGHNIDFTSRDITQHHSGVILTRTDFKQANRLCENLLVTAEKFSAVAFLYGAKYPDKALDKATRQILCAQHHDSITGTNNEISFIDLMIEYREAAELLKEVIEKACKFIASGVKTNKKDNFIFVFNPLTWKRGGKCYFNVPKGFPDDGGAVLEDIKGNIYPSIIENGKGFFIAKELAPMGYSLFKIKKLNQKPLIVKGTDTVIENRNYRVSVDREKGGSITSIYMKKENREIVDEYAETPANTVYVLREIHNRMETQHELYTTGHKMLSSDYRADVKSEKTELYQRLIITVKLDMVATLIEEITLYKDSDIINFKTIIDDYQGEDDLFTVAFPINIKGGQVVYDDRQTPHVSTRSKKFMSFQTHQYASFSGCRVLPAGAWFGIEPTAAVEFKGKGKINIGMTAIIRKPLKELEKLSDKLLFTLSKKAIPVTPYPDCEQHGGSKIIHFNEDIYETDTRFVMSVAGDKNLYINKLLSSLKKSEVKRIYNEVKENGYTVAYFKDSDNAYKKSVDVLAVIGQNEIGLENFCNDIEEQFRKDSIFTPKSFVLLENPGMAEDMGCVLLNNGTAASSVEGQGTLNMMLFHTASFYGNMGMVTGDKELVPEQKTHVFTYALYPHKSDYRKAMVYKKAYEFDNSLFSVTEVKPSKNQFLPQEMGFLKSPNNFMITAFKAKGFPYANFTKCSNSPAERGFTVRGNEINSLNSKVELHFGVPVTAAEITNLLEENGKPVKAINNSVSFKTTAHSIDTLALKLEKQQKIGTASIDAKTEAVNSVYIRSWEHDMGSTPMGNLGFAATIEKLPREGKTTETLCINAVNNVKNCAVKETIHIETTEGIVSELSKIDVELDGGDYKKIPLKVTLRDSSTEGQVKLRYKYDGIEFYDVYEFGYFNPQVSLELNKDKLVCTVKNVTNQYLEGGLYIASPFETWGSELLGEGKALGVIAPAAYKVQLKPKEIKKYNFTCKLSNDTISSFWAAVKLCVNGRIHFGFCNRLGHRHNEWAHIFYDEIVKDNGSIKKLLEM